MTHHAFSMIVAMLADLERAQERHKLENLLVRFKGDVPVVLVAGKAPAPVCAHHKQKPAP